MGLKKVSVLQNISEFHHIIHKWSSKTVFFVFKSEV